MARPDINIFRTHAADMAVMRALIDGPLADPLDPEIDTDPRCPCCGCWLGFGDKEWCADCQYGDDREWS